MRLDPTGIIRLLRSTGTRRPRQAADVILSAQVDQEVGLIITARTKIRDFSAKDPEPEVCDLCGKPPGPGHEGCNRAITAGLD